MEARISVEELRAAFKKQMSQPGNETANLDTQIYDPMEKVSLHLKFSNSLKTS